MLPRLLTKREIDVKKAQERQRDVEAGGKLARTVDSLRELRAKEEKEFEEWRTTELAQIQREIGVKQLEREALDSEIRTKRGIRDALMEPLTAQWEEVNTAIGALKVREDVLLEGELNLRRAIALNIQRERDNEEKARFLEVEKIKVARLQEGALDYNREAKTRLELVKEVEKKTIDTITERDKKSVERASDLDYREGHVRLVIETYNNKDKDLLQREALLKDRTELLERNIKRYERRIPRDTTEG
jgi:hypothetical protein